MLDNNNLQIAMLELSDQNRAVLDFYFNSTGSSLYTVVGETEADAFITDYDFPGAKEHVADLLNTNKKPIIILSVREQDIPHTIWLVKPLSADALTKAADSLKQLIADNVENKAETLKALESETLLAEPLQSMDVIAEKPAIETSNIDINTKNERASGSSVASPSFAGDFDLDLDDDEDDTLDSSNSNEDTYEGKDIFDLLDEEAEESIADSSDTINNEDEDLDVHKKIEAQLAIAGTASLAALAVTSSDSSEDDSEASSLDSLKVSFENNSDINDVIEAAETTEIKDSAHLEFTDVLLNNSDNIIEDEQESDVDALLDSLMSETEDDLTEDLFIDTSDAETSGIDLEDLVESEANNELNLSVEKDIFRENLALDSELEEQSNSDSESSGYISVRTDDSKISLEETQLEVTQSDKIESDGLNAFDLLEESSPDEEIESENIETDKIELDDAELESPPLAEAKETEDIKDENLELDAFDFLDENLSSTEDTSLDLDDKAETDSTDSEITLLVEEESALKSEGLVLQDLALENKAIVDDAIEDKVDNSIDNMLDSINTEISLEEPKAENVKPDEIDLDELSLLDESIPLKEEDPLVIEEKESVLLDENFTLHSNHNSTDEDSFAKTLEVDYSTVKPDESSKIVSAYDSLESEAITEVETSFKTENSNIGIEESLENDMFNFDLEQNEQIENMLEVSEPSINSIEVSENDSLSLSVVNAQSSADDDIDSLLAEVSGVTGGITDAVTNGIDESQENIIEVASFASVVTPKKTNLDDLEQAATTAEDDSEFNLQSLLNEVRQEAGTSNSDSEGNADNGYNQTKAEKRWMQLCGNNDAITTPKEVAKITYKLKNHLLSALLDEIEKVKGSEQLYRLKYYDLIIVIDHSQDTIYCNLPVSNEDYAEVCFAEIEHKQIKIHDLDYSEVRLYRNKIKENPERAHSIESFVWVTSLLTSRGRLPEKTDITKEVGLKVWPNLTRCELSPHAMNIAAVFSKHPGSLLEIPEWLKIEQRYVFAFYNAAFILGMIESDSSKLKKSSFSFGRKNSKIKSEERGFFGRLLKRLKS